MTNTDYIIPTSKQRPVLEGGAYLGICVQAIDLGTQDGEWQGKPKKDRKVRLVFELPGETAVFKDGGAAESFLVGRTYVASLHEKSTLRPHVKAIIGEVPNGLDLSKLINRGAVITISKEPKASDPSVFVNKIEGIAPLMKGQVVPLPTNDPFFYATAMGKGGTFDRLPDFIKEDVSNSPEFKAASESKPF